LWNAFEKVGYCSWDCGSGGVLVAFCGEQNFVFRNRIVVISRVCTFFFFFFLGAEIFLKEFPYYQHFLLCEEEKRGM
jgi:hypothetical protein